MTPKRPAYVWFSHDHADAYLLAAAHHLARASTSPVTAPLPEPSVAATLYCAFAAEAYVNVALIRILGEEEYKPLSRMPVRSKYFLVTRLGLREVWFTSGEAVLESLDQLFTARNQLVHAQPERFVWHPSSEPPEPAPHTELRNVARWVGATAEAASRLGRSHAELTEFERVAAPLVELEPLFRCFDPERDGSQLDSAVRALMQRLLREDEEPFANSTELNALLDEQDPDWDLEGLDYEE